MRVAVFGAGLVGQRTARILEATTGLDVVLVAQRRSSVPGPDGCVRTGWPHRDAAGAEVVVLATASEHQYAVAQELLRSGTHVVTTADDPTEIARLWGLDALARAHGCALVVGASYAPGVSTLLASYLSRGLREITAIRTARFGTGGPACAREHHRAMSGPALEVQAGRMLRPRGGSGRELVWFPDPVGPADCYRAGLAEPYLLHRAFPTVARIEARQAATRRDRLTARLPMLRPPHAEGLVGAVWAEVRGRSDRGVEHRVMAATGPQATGAAAMAAAFCVRLSEEREDEGIHPGSRSAAVIENVVSLLQLVSRDIGLWTYDGSQIVTQMASSSSIQAARKWRIAGENPAIATMLNDPTAIEGTFA